MTTSSINHVGICLNYLSLSAIPICILMHKTKSLLCTLLIGFILTMSSHFNGVSAQQNVKDSTISMHLITAHFAYQFPSGDMASRFGHSAMVGPAYFYKSSENWLLGAEVGFFFGDKVKDKNNILSNIETEDGNIVDVDGIYATYHFYERGYSFLAKAGKIFPFRKPNPNSGIMLGAGAGLIQHKIFIDHRDRTAPQITGDYLKGYDELKRGPALNVFAGYLCTGNSKVVNFYANIDLTVGFTKDVRPYSFAKRQYNDGKYTDYIVSLKLGWLIPVYKRAPKDFYYY